MTSGDSTIFSTDTNSNDTRSRDTKSGAGRDRPSNSKAVKPDVKHYFLDTSSLMLNPLGLFKLASCKIDDSIVPRQTFDNIASVLDNINADITSESPNNIYISEMVEWELNNLKDQKKDDLEVTRQARQVIHTLTHIKRYGHIHGESLRTGITLPNGSKIYSVPHDEFLFKLKNIQAYEPTRDDRILSDYFSISQNFGIKPLRGKNKLHIPKGAFMEVVTEDTNMEGAVYDMNSKRGRNISCKPLTFERTKHPNPAEQYTGIYSRPLVLNPKDYSWAFDLKNKKRPISIPEIISRAENSADFKNLDDIVMNQFVRIRSSTSSDDASPNEFFLRRQSGEYFEHLKYAAEFIEQEYDSKKAVSKSVEHKRAIPEFTSDKSRLMNIISRNDFYSNQRNKLKKKIRAARDEQDFEEINDMIKTFLENNGSSSGSDKSQAFSRKSLLDMSFNPLVVPDSEQVLFVEYLNDPAMGLVSFLAPQGAGKTYFALASGLRQVRLGLYDKIIYLRPVVVTGEDTGYNPGKPSEKIKPLMMSCEDALMKIYSMNESPDFYMKYPSHKISDNTAFLNGLLEQNILDYQVLTYMAGRTLSRAFVIMDESHLLNREQLRLFIGRIGETSKCVLLGDYAQLDAANADVVRKYHLTLDKLGLSHLIEKVLVNNNKEYTDIYGHISINRPYTKRSRVAGIGNVL